MQLLKRICGGKIRRHLILATAVCATLVLAGAAQAESFYAGTYTITKVAINEVSDPEPFVASCPLGQNGYVDDWHAVYNDNANSNYLGTEGMYVDFDLGDTYALDGIKTYHFLFNNWWSVGAVDFYTSDDGVNWTFLGTDGTVVQGYNKAWRYYRESFEARYVRVHVHSDSWSRLVITQIELEVAPDFLPVSQIQIDGLEGARHFIWMEAECAEYENGYLLNDLLDDPLDPCDPCDPCNPVDHAYYKSLVSGSRLTDPCMYVNSCREGDFADSYGYSRFAFRVPAAFDDAVFYSFYGTYYDDLRSNIRAWFDGVRLGYVSLPGTGEDADLGSVPKAWSPPIALGSLESRGYDFQMYNDTTYCEDSHDGFLIVEGSDNIILPDSVVDGDWTWRAAPYLDPNTGVIGGTFVTATVTVSGPVDEGYIRVDDEVVESFSDPGVFMVPISGMGDHSLEVETFAYPFDPCAYAPGVYDPCNPPALRGRVLAGAWLRLSGCSGEILAGDLNEDCYVNLSDFVLISNDWMYDHSSDPNCGVTYPLPDGDADNNCVVNMIDAALLGADWLECNDPCGPCP
ncbi:MAG: discoidin domain-containing protein [Sedimentisphaerales bacterium]|nr:discoidin domain-containing protein [Sedimentisphaerales bacterium]